MANKLYGSLARGSVQFLFFLLSQRAGRLLGLDKLRRDLQRLLVGIERFWDMPGSRQRAAEFEIALSAGLQFHRAGKIADRFVEFALLLRQQAKTEPGAVLVGIEAQRLLETVVRLLIFCQGALD